MMNRKQLDEMGVCVVCSGKMNLSDGSLCEGCEDPNPQTHSPRYQIQTNGQGISALYPTKEAAEAMLKHISDSDLKSVSVVEVK